MFAFLLGVQVDDNNNYTIEERQCFVVVVARYYESLLLGMGAVLVSEHKLHFPPILKIYTDECIVLYTF